MEERFRELVEWLPAVVYEADTGPEGVLPLREPPDHGAARLLRGRVDVRSEPVAAAPARRGGRSSPGARARPGARGARRGRSARERVPDDPPLRAGSCGFATSPACARTNTAPCSGAASSPTSPPSARPSSRWPTPTSGTGRWSRTCPPASTRPSAERWAAGTSSRRRSSACSATPPRSGRPTRPCGGRACTRTTASGSSSTSSAISSRRPGPSSSPNTGSATAPAGPSGCATARCSRSATTASG